MSAALTVLARNTPKNNACRYFFIVISLTLAAMRGQFARPVLPGQFARIAAFVPPLISTKGPASRVGSNPKSLALRTKQLLGFAHSAPTYENQGSMAPAAIATDATSRSHARKLRRSLLQERLHAFFEVRA